MSLRTHFAVIHDSFTFAHPDDRSSCCGWEVDEPIAPRIRITCGKAATSPGTDAKAHGGVGSTPHIPCIACGQEGLQRPTSGPDAGSGLRRPKASSANEMILILIAFSTISRFCVAWPW